MVRKCSICHHEKVNEINNKIAKNESIASIAHSFALSKHALARPVRNHFVKSLAPIYNNIDISSARDLFEDIRRTEADFRCYQALAEQSGNIKLAMEGGEKVLKALITWGDFVVKGIVLKDKTQSIYDSDEWNAVGRVLDQLLIPYPELGGK